MDLQGWEKRYRSEAVAEEGAAPTKLLAQTAQRLAIGKALDLACGTGRNALWLALQGWQMRAVDGAPTAIAALEQSAAAQKIALQTEVADLRSPSFSLPDAEWDLVAICYYLQRDLMERAKAAVKPGGVLLIIVHSTEAGEEPTESRLRPGELERYFADWEIQHRYEGKPDDPQHKRAVAEVVARKPLKLSSPNSV